jgi:hypothetical protein
MGCGGLVLIANFPVAPRQTFKTSGYPKPSPLKWTLKPFRGSAQSALAGLKLDSRMGLACGDNAYKPRVFLIARPSFLCLGVLSQ